MPSPPVRDASALLATLDPLARGVRAPVELHRAWSEGHVVVLEHLVHGAPVTFDVRETDATWRVEVLTHHAVDEPLLAGLGLEPAQGGRHLVAALPSTHDALPSAIWARCREVLDRVARAGPTPATAHLLEALGLDRTLVVVDVGANPLDLPPYARLLGLGACRVVGFEPQPDAFVALQGRDPAREVYLPHAIGEPGPGELRVYGGSGFASTFDVDDSSIDLVGDPHWHEQTRLRERVPLELTALDDVADLPALDLLKIDVQGGELAVFRSGRRALASAVCVIPEVSFFPLYVGAPTFGDVHAELVGQGFLLHKFLFQKSVHLHGSQGDVSRAAASRSQLVDGDAVYLRDLRTLTAWPSEQVAALVLLATFVVDSPDLAVRALDLLVARGDVDASLPATYAASTYV